MIIQNNCLRQKQAHDWGLFRVWNHHKSIIIHVCKGMTFLNIFLCSHCSASHLIGATLLFSEFLPKGGALARSRSVWHAELICAHGAALPALLSLPAADLTSRQQHEQGAAAVRWSSHQKAFRTTSEQWWLEWGHVRINVARWWC